MTDYARTNKKFFVSNPDNEEESPRTRQHNIRRQPQPLPYQHHRPSPSQPTFLDTDLQVPPLKSTSSTYHHQYHPPLSPASSASPPADELAPPPANPSLHHISSSPDVQLRLDNQTLPLSMHDPPGYHDQLTSPPATSRRGASTSRLFGALRPPFGSRPITRSPAAEAPRHIRTSPTAPPQDVASPSSLPSSTSTTSSLSPEKSILVTSDSERYVTVTIGTAKSAAQIRELILTKLNIFTEDEHHPFSIYRTEIGNVALGEALSNERLWALCRDQGDSKGTLKFFVSVTGAPVHDLPSQQLTQPLESYHVPPMMTQIAPLRPRRRSLTRSRNGSFSSQSDIVPIEGGYEPDLDIPHREHKPSSRSQVTPSSVLSPPNSAGQPRRRPSAHVPPRPGSPLVPDQSSGSPGERSWAQARKDNFAPNYPIPGVPPPLSPTSNSFLDESLLDRYPPHTRSGSDAAAEADILKSAGEQPTDTMIKPSRPRDIPPVGKMRSEPSRENMRGAYARKTYDEEDPDWEPVPNQAGWTGDDPDRASSVSTVSRNARPSTGNSKQRPASPYHTRPFTAGRVQPAASPMMADSRAASQPRSGRQPLTPGFLPAWKAPDSGTRATKLPTTLSTPYTPSLKRNNAKSMDNLKGSPTATTRRPQLPTRPGGNIGYTPSNSSMSSSGTPKSYEPPRGSFNRPLVPHATPEFNSHSTGTRGYPSNSLMSTSGLDPYQRPSSALGDSATSPVYGSSRMQSPTNGYLESGDSARSPRAPSPHRPFHSHAVGPRPRPTNNSGDRSDRSSDIPSGPENSTPPRTPVSPQSHGSDHQNGLIVEPSSPSSVENPMIRDNRSSEMTLRPEDKVRVSKLLGTDLLGSQQSTIPTPHLPPPLAATKSYEEEEEESDFSGNTWIVPPGSKSPRPPLTVQIDSGTPTPSSSSNTVTTTSNRPPLPSDSSSTAHLAPNRSRRPDSSFVDADSDSWAPRPPPENIYEHLEKFFPKHDLDKPVIEASSGDTSPTSLEPSAALPSHTSSSTAAALASAAAATATAMPAATIVHPAPPIVEEKGRIHRGKKSIRIVAQEHKKKIDRSSRASDTYTNMMRKRSTKLWGSKLEEVTTGQARNASSSPDSPSGGPTTFKWVRGELIGKGTYGRVYLALNATTGEMIAVKQVELPQTASDKADSRQHMVVQALKSESETLRDLDHPNIVQYLGFEETPTNLSIFLEYVPGGSVGSCLLKHGKFEDNVTRSFTAQILGGLEYLHSKGILHRDLKADNILVEMTGVCKISDFGISKRTDDMQGGAFTAMQGTVFWMAPEVINTQKSGYNNKIDIWSVGCVVLEMWAGMRPWNGEEMLAVMFKLYQSKQPPPVPEDIVLSPEADDFRRRCFAINPDDRPSAAELRRHPYLSVPPDWIFNGFT
ncbi:hypothetical protein CPB83DRAFT_5940 [Crepidotus variabilis]|uniref:Protein kinase domain-containing protein n=1 Tax=Crepidotus variabilis TaxID=179855 RepID=A0A9P6JWR9_9AGAR|nr:hypothetical protein CPB83DRAFT_5940 [Crepidotus variabilis]